MMETLHNHLWDHGHFLWWVLIGWLGMAVFSTRFFVQWYATEKKRQVVVPASFWWLSLLGSLLLLGYGCYKHDPVFILSYTFNSIPYIRNLVIQRRHKAAHLDCGSCGTVCPPNSKFCFACGAKLDVAPAPVRP